MGWSEEKRKQIWNKKYNPAVTFGIFLMMISLFSGWITLILGLIIIYQGFKLYRKYK